MIAHIKLKHNTQHKFLSIDQLLGLKPLDGETYIPEKTATKEFWNQKLEYLLRTRKSYWNDDYARFLISQVWKIHVFMMTMHTPTLIQRIYSLRM